MCLDMCVSMHILRSKKDFILSVLSLYHVALRNLTQIVSLKERHPLQSKASYLPLALSFWDRISFWTWRSLIRLDWLAGKNLSIFLASVSPGLGLQGIAPCLAFHMGDRDPNPSHRVCVENRSSEVNHLPQHALLLLWYSFTDMTGSTVLLGSTILSLTLDSEELALSSSLRCRCHPLGYDINRVY